MCRCVNESKTKNVPLVGTLNAIGNACGTRHGLEGYDNGVIGNASDLWCLCQVCRIG